MPLDSDTEIDSDLVLDTVSPNKDVDGLTTASAGRLSHGMLEGGFMPCTPNGCMELIRRSAHEKYRGIFSYLCLHCLL